MEQARYQLGAGERVNHGDKTMVKRRKFLIGAGALATGGSAALGTGATMYSANDRANSIDVVADNPSGVIGFQDTSPGDIVRQTSGGELEIDFAEYSGAEGVNIGSEVEIGGWVGGDPESGGRPDMYSENVAFTIINQAKGTYLDFDVTYELDGNLNNNGSKLVYGFGNKNSDPQAPTDGSHDSGILTVEGEASSGDTFSYTHNSNEADDGSASVPEGKNVSVQDPLLNRAPGDVIWVSLYVDTDNTNSDTSEDLSGKLTIEATPGEGPAAE